MKRGLILILFTALISGVSIFINNFGVKGIDATVFTFAKNLIVSLLLVSIILGFKEYKNLKNLKKKEWMSLLLIGLIGGSIPFVLFFNGLKMVDSAVGSFIHKLMFLFVAVFAFLFLKERFSWKVLVPAGLLVIGNFLLLNLNSFEFGVGGLLILIATIFWAVENVISKHVLKTIEPKVVAFGRLFFGSVFIFIYMANTSKASMVLTLSFEQFGWIMLTAVFLLLYVITWYTGLAGVKVTTATSILLLGSVITTVLSYVFLGTVVSLAQAVGMLSVLCGIIGMIIITYKNYSSTTSIA